MEPEQREEALQHVNRLMEILPGEDAADQSMVLLRVFLLLWVEVCNKGYVQEAARQLMNMMAWVDKQKPKDVS